LHAREDHAGGEGLDGGLGLLGLGGSPGDRCAHRGTRQE
jgi:hypothetical protein